MPAPQQRTAHEIENGFRQFDLCLEAVRYYLDPERPFALRPNLIMDLQREAVVGIETYAGRYRSGPVRIHKSRHIPPDAHLVESLVRNLCEYINDNWHELNAFHLSAYAMWRLNWIHPFTDGNGRTARSLSYLVLCVKVGHVLPGSPTIPQQIELDKAHYIKAMEAADDAQLAGRIDVSDTETMIRNMLARQLLGVIEQAGGVELLATR